jgi:hypothetical protein
MRFFPLVLGASAIAVMVGCHSMTAQTVVDSAAACPAEFQDQVRMSAAAVPWTIPAEFAQGQDLNSVLGRRISVSI